MYPLFFEPIYKETLWGGTKMRQLFNRDLPYTHTGESWEIAGHEHGHSIISNGGYKGRTLEEACIKEPLAMLGEAESTLTKFPLLVKIIDANDNLSVQVHPGDAYARKNEKGELGKTEMWYILSADEGAKLYVGIKKGITKDQFKAGIESGTLEDCIEEIMVRAGDVINIPSGMLHAIGKGIVLAEIQQNSDTTYRVYDWNRVGLDGKPRQLHVEKALDVLNFQQPSALVTGYKVQHEGAAITYYIANDYFAVEKIEVSSQWQDATIEENRESFHLYTCIEGQGHIQTKGEIYSFSKGQSFMMPAALGEYALKGQCILLKSYVPKKECYMKKLCKEGFTKGGSKEEDIEICFGQLD